MATLTFIRGLVELTRLVPRFAYAKVGVQWTPGSDLRSQALYCRQGCPYFYNTPRLNIPSTSAESPAPRPVAPSWTMDSLVKEWALFLDKCLENRIDIDLFAAAATQLHTRSPLPGHKLAALLVKPRAAGVNSVDPRVIVYAERLLALKKVDASDILAATFQFSKDRPVQSSDNTNPKDPSRWQNPSELDEILFHRLHKAFSGERPERPVSNAEATRTVKAVTRWMSAMVASHTNDSMLQAMAGIQQQPQQQSINVREGLGMLVVGLIENVKILQLLNRDQLKGGSFPQLNTGYGSCL